MATDAQAGRTFSFSVDEETAGLIEQVCAALGVEPEEAFLRGVTLISAELAKQAVLIPTYLEDEFEDEEE
jgi:hypothetical protein